MRIVYRAASASVFYDFDFEEFIVRFYRDGVYLPEADYFTDDRTDACATADAFEVAA